MSSSKVWIVLAGIAAYAVWRAESTSAASNTLAAGQSATPASPTLPIGISAPIVWNPGVTPTLPIGISAPIAGPGTMETAPIGISAPISISAPQGGPGYYNDPIAYPVGNPGITLEED